MSLLICPRCEVTLKPKHLPQGGIWQCGLCHGVMANVAVLRMYLGNDIVKKFWLKAITDPAITDKKCPSCRQSLNAFKVEHNEQKIILDICLSCQIIWFDADELEIFPKTKTEELPPEIRQKLAIYNIQLENEFEEELTRFEATLKNILDVIYTIVSLFTR